MTTTGGENLARMLREAREAKGIDGVDVGVFESAKYPPVHVGKNGGRKQTPHFVATVQAWNEFGTKKKDGSTKVKERPAIRNAIRVSEDGVREIVKDNIDGATGVLTEHVASLIGEYVKGQVQKSIYDLDSPENAKSTIKRKGSSNPLIDNKTMVDSWTWRVYYE